MVRHCVFLLAACAAPVEHDLTVENAGVGCILSWPEGLDTAGPPALPPLYEPGEFVVNEPVIFQFYVPVASCQTDIEASCSVERRGNTLVIASRASWNEQDVCTREARPLPGAICKVAPLEAGTYTVEFGDVRAELGVPGFPLGCF